ncbi:MAG TPA: cyclase family protein, partial [Allosphingosinicella sp.]|nr:cyclase family protein [Allosphingosinicella sp.]
SFQIGRIDMVANTGTYLDAPFHRYADGADLAGLTLEQLAALPGLLVRAEAQAVDTGAFEGLDVAGKAVLVHTGWDRHWRSDAYAQGHPFLTEAAARLLAERGAVLVGIDSYNIDDTRTRSRPVHTILLGAGVLICEHMTNLAALPDSGFAFSAVPPRIAGMGTFPVRAFAEIG